MTRILCVIGMILAVWGVTAWLLYRAKGGKDE